MPSTRLVLYDVAQDRIARYRREAERDRLVLSIERDRRERERLQLPRFGVRFPPVGSPRRHANDRHAA